MSHNNTNNKNNKRRKYNNQNWTVYKNYPRSINVTVYDIQGSPISEEIINRIVSQTEEAIKAHGLNSLAIAVSKG